MSEIGGLDSLAPDEGGSGSSEQVSEQARERFAEAQRKSKQSAKDEKKARRRDDRVAATIKQFLSDDKYSHLFQLISKLSARDCPSVFILAVLSLIHEGALEAVNEFIAEQNLRIEAPQETSLAVAGSALPPTARKDILLWTVRLELVISKDAVKILTSLMVDEANIDGSVLQLATFVLMDYFQSIDVPLEYAVLQPLTIKILQDLLEPHMDGVEEHFKALRKKERGSDED